MGKKAILLVEDQPNDVRLMQAAFQQWGVSNPLHVVTDGDQAFDYLKGEGCYADREKYPLPGLVLLDLSLPTFPGFAVLSWMRSQPELGSVAVIVLSCSEDREDIDRAYRLGANSYLIKTSDLNRLRHMVIDINYFILTQFSPESVIHFG
jgi:CheY-like chemotaxis protein